MDSPTLQGSLQCFGRETRPPTHGKDYEAQYPGIRGAACQTECTCTKYTTDTHGLQEDAQKEQGHVQFT